MFPRLLSVLQWCLQFQLEMRAPAWHALYTFVAKSMPHPKTFPSAQLIGDNSGYNRPEQREEMETQFNQCNRHQPEMSQSLILQRLLKAKSCLIFIQACFALCRRRSLQKCHCPFWPSFVSSDVNDNYAMSKSTVMSKNYYYYCIYATITSLLL